MSSSQSQKNLGNEPLNFELSWDEIVLNFFIFSTSVPSCERGQPKPMSLTVPNVERKLRLKLRKWKLLSADRQNFHIFLNFIEKSVSLFRTVLMPIHLNFIQGDFVWYKSWSRKVSSSHAQKNQLFNIYYLGGLRCHCWILSFKWKEEKDNFKTCIGLVKNQV